MKGRMVTKAPKDNTVMARKSISLFLPAYNEEENIEVVVREALAALSRITDLFEVIIVNDGSTDATGEIADRLSASSYHVRVVHHKANQGYGAALRSGINASQYDYIAFTDADRQFDLSELKELARYVPRYKAVLGYRRYREDNMIRIINAKAWNVLMRFLFGINVRDIDCAFKLFDRRMLQGIAFELKSHGAMISAEILTRLKREGVVWKEIPVTHLPRIAGSPTGGTIRVIVKAFREIPPLYWDGLGNVTLKQAFRFGVVGVLNTLVDIVAYVFLTRFIPVFAPRVVVAKGISFLLGTIVSFNANRRWTFSQRRNTNFGEIIRFYSTVGVGLLINVLSMHVFATVLHVPDLAAALLSTVMTFAWNFTASKAWVFGSQKPGFVPDMYKRLFRQIVHP